MAKRLDEIESELPKISGKDYLSPVMFDLEIQRQRIMYILHFALKKMRIMVHLPYLLRNDCKILKRFLKPGEVDFIAYACSKYEDNGESVSPDDQEGIMDYVNILEELTLRRSKDKYSSRTLLGTLGEDVRVDYQISQVIEIIMSNQDLVKFIESHRQDLPQPVHNLIECLSHLKDLIHEKLMITSKEQMDNDKELRVAYKSNFVITQNIKQLQKQLEKQQKELGAELEKKNVVLKNYNDQLEQLEEDFQLEMMKKVQKSEKQMMNDSFSSEARQVDLEHDAREATNQYTNLLETNLSEESQLRLKRNKLEAQLASWLSKYDNDVGEKQTELENLQKEYSDMKAEYEELMEKFNEQTIEYDILMAERDEEETRIFNEMAMEFLRNRSARRIQRAWRAYWQRKLERRRARKAGKGKEKKKAKKEKTRLDRKTNAEEVLQKTFKKKSYLFDEMDTTKEFSTAPVKIDLEA